MITPFFHTPIASPMLPPARPSALPRVELVQVTGRLCPDRVQPNIRPGMVLAVRRAEKNGTIVVTAKTDKNRTWRLSPDRFMWRAYDPAAVATRHDDREMATIANRVVATHDCDTLCRALIAPMLLTEVAYLFALRAHDAARAMRERRLRCVGRAGLTPWRELQDEWAAERLAGADNLSRLKGAARHFVDKHERDFQLWYFSATNAMLRHAPDYADWQPILANAAIGLQLLELAEELARAGNHLLHNTPGQELDTELPYLLPLRVCMEQYLGNSGWTGFGADDNLRRSLQIIRNDILTSHWRVIGGTD